MFAAQRFGSRGPLLTCVKPHLHGRDGWDRFAVMPAVSVIMVFHRVIPFLAPAVQSILTQTWRDLELVLVDNGTGAGVAPLGDLGRDPRLRLISRSGDTRIAAGFNSGVAEARGEFIAVMDYDDLAQPQRIERQVAALRADSGLGLVTCRAETIDGQGATIGREFVLEKPEQQMIFSAYSMPAPTPSLMGKAEVFRRFPRRSEFLYAVDYDFFSRAAEVWPTRGVPETLLRYRVHAQQATMQYQARQVFEACAIRLLTARRRSGRAEGLSSVLAEMGTWVDSPPALPVIYARFAHWCLEEKFPLLAVYHARKLLSVRRDVQTIAAVLQIYLNALRIAPGEASILTRMFLSGPLRTHRLKPA